jgi:hypothetical protein
VRGLGKSSVTDKLNLDLSEMKIMSVSISESGNVFGTTIEVLDGEANV